MSAFEGALSLSMTHAPGVCSLAVLALKTSSAGLRGSWYWVAGWGMPTTRSQSMRSPASLLVTRLPSPPSKQLGETMSGAATGHETNGKVLLAALAALVPTIRKSAVAQSASSGFHRWIREEGMALTSMTPFVAILRGLDAPADG